MIKKCYLYHKIYAYKQLIYVVIKHCNNLNELFTLTLCGLVIPYCYMHISSTKIHTKYI